MPVPEPPPEPVGGGSVPTEPLDTLASAPGPARPSARRGVLTAALVVLALGVAGLTGAALARGGGPSDPQTAVAAATGTPSPSGNPGKPWRGGRHGGPGLLGLAGALHGELVVPDGSGGYRTVVVQRGKAADVGGSSLTVTSDDGWSRTYDVPASARVGALREGLGSIKADDQVLVVAEQKGGTLTADHVIDLSSIQQGLDGWPGGGPGRMGGFGGPGGNSGTGQGTGYGV